MYASLIPWLSVKYHIKPFIRRNGAGEKTYGEPVESLCYPVGDIRLITNTDGAEVTSTTQLYLPGTEQIKVTDAVIFNGEERPIQRINEFYRDGFVDIKVVFL